MLNGYRLRILLLSGDSWFLNFDVLVLRLLFRLFTFRTIFLLVFSFRGWHAETDNFLDVNVRFLESFPQLLVLPLLFQLFVLREPLRYLVQLIHILVVVVKSFLGVVDFQVLGHLFPLGEFLFDYLVNTFYLFI